MILTQAEIESVKSSLNVDLIPEEKAQEFNLQDMFGEHTFFVSPDGIFVFMKDDEKEERDGTATLCAVALSTEDKENTFVQQQPPEKLSIQLDLKTTEIRNAQ